MSALSTTPGVSLPDGILEYSTSSLVALASMMPVPDWSLSNLLRAQRAASHVKRL